VIGQVGFDPGSQWGSGLESTADNTLRRKASVTAGAADGSNAFAPALEWDGLATDTFDGLGSHATSGPGDAAPAVTSTSPANGAIDVPKTADIAINFSEPVSVSAGAFSISCASTGAHTFALGGSGASYTLDPDVDFGTGETCTVTVDAAGVSDADAFVGLVPVEGALEVHVDPAGQGADGTRLVTLEGVAGTSLDGLIADGNLLLTVASA